MSRSRGARQRAAPGLAALALAACTLVPAGARAQRAIPSPDEEVIQDPELAGVPLAAPPASPAATTAAESGTLARVEVGTRLMAWPFTHHPGQDHVGSMSWAAVELEHRRSSALRFAAGARLDVRAIAPRERDGGLSAARTELYVTPLAAYADATPGRGVHVRVGYQVLSFGRFDLFSQADVLARYDLTRGVSTDAASLRVGDLAARLDWDVRPWLTLSAAYVPLFEPHRFAGYGSNAALVPVLGGPHALAAFAAIGQHVARSFQPQATADVIRALGPERSFAEPQVMTRLTARGDSKEVAFTVGSALEHLPVIAVTDNFAGYLENPAPATLNPPAADLLRGQGAFTVRYPRYAVLAVDGSIELGPVHVKAEVAYTPRRWLYAATAGGAEVIRPEPVGLAHGRLGLEYLHGERLVLVVEGMLSTTLRAPLAADRRWWGYGAGGRTLPAGLAAAQWRPGGGPVRLEMGGFVLPGPSVIVAPRVEWAAREALFIDAGVLLVGGPRPTSPWQANVALGGLFDRLSQVFVGARWLL